MRSNLVLSSEKNLYEILEISTAASPTAIKAAYRKLARKYHPDLNSGDKTCVEKFKEITEAYEILSDTEKKKNYDLLSGLYKQTSQSKYSEANKAYKETLKEENKQKEEGFSNIFNEILDGFRKTTTSSKKQEFKTKQLRPERGKDVNTEISITLSESLNGTSKTVNILHTEICPNCQGRPFVNGAKCPICGGLGEQSSHKKLNVKIPAGIKHGSKIRIPNEGNKGYNGGKNGDLYLKVKIENNSSCQFENNNILCKVPITPYEAALGGSIEFLSPNGKMSMKLTPNTQNGQKFRLNGEGLSQNGQKGDMIVTVSIEVPKKLSAEEMELYKKLKEIDKNNIRDNQ